LAKLKRRLEAEEATKALNAARKSAAVLIAETKKPGAKKAKRKLNLSPERRAQLAAAMKARWAAKRAAEATAVEPTQQAPEGGHVAVANEDDTKLYVAYPQSNGDKISQGYVLKACFPKYLAEKLSYEELIDQFEVYIHSGVSGQLNRGTSNRIPKFAFQIAYDEQHDRDALAVRLPSLSNGCQEWWHGIEVLMRRPERPDVPDTGQVYRAVRFVRAV
jgi:hypothetical protein